MHRTHQEYLTSQYHQDSPGHILLSKAASFLVKVHTRHFSRLKSDMFDCKLPQILQICPQRRADEGVPPMPEIPPVPIWSCISQHVSSSTVHFPRTSCPGCWQFQDSMRPSFKPWGERISWRLQGEKHGSLPWDFVTILRDREYLDGPWD